MGDPDGIVSPGPSLTAADAARPALTASLLLACSAALALAVTVGSSTLDAGWTKLGAGLPVVSLAGALAALPFALAREKTEPGWTSAFGAAVSPFAAALAIYLETRAGAVDADPAAPVVAFLLLAAAWSSAYLLAWWSLRPLNPVPGLLPTGALLAANLLNHPDGQMPYVFAFLAAAMVLLLASNHARMAAMLADLPTLNLLRTARFWTAGALLGALALVAAAVLPPASSSDLTAGWQPSWPVLSNLFPGTGSGTGTGPGSLASVGFAPTASLSGPLVEGTPVTIFTYAPATTTTDAPLYFRAINLPNARNGTWSAVNARQAVGIPKNTALAPADQEGPAVIAGVQVTMVTPISSPSGLLVYPGELVSADRSTYIYQQAPAGSLVTVDAVQSRVIGGTYNVQVALPDATESQLRSAGTAYPDWVLPYRGGAQSYTAPGYRSPAAAARVAQLARTVATGATDPYDQALAIQSYLRSSDFTYTLTPPTPPGGTDPLEYFLFTSRQGFCQYFAVAMGDLLRSLGIPTRLVNGFGPGKWDAGKNRYVVTSADAHTWVEAYFPGFGWIPFEPTPDGTYSPIPRAPEVTSPDPATAPASTSPVTDTSAPTGPLAGAAGWVGRRVDGARSQPWWLVVTGLALIELCLLAVVAIRPRTVAGVWRRLHLLSRLAGVRPSRSDTPLEFTARLARRFPDSGELIGRLGDGVSTASYGRPGSSSVVRAEVRRSWLRLQPILIRAAAGRLMPGRGRFDR